MHTTITIDVEGEYPSLEGDEISLTVHPDGRVSEYHRLLPSLRARRVHPGEHVSD